MWSWRAIFWFNLVIGVIAFSMTLVFVPETSDRGRNRIDVAGIVLGAVALASGSFAVIQGEQSGYFTWWILALFVLAVLSGVCFVHVERRVDHAILDISMFRRSAFSGSLFVAFAAYFGTFSIFFFTALYLQVVADASAFATAIDFLPMAVGLIVASVLTVPGSPAAGPGCR